jgi:hypothetical protein
MTSDPQDERTINLLRALWDAWTAADEHLSGFDGGEEMAVVQSSDDWTDAEWAGLQVWVGGRPPESVEPKVLYAIADWRQRKQQDRGRQQK